MMMMNIISMYDEEIIERQVIDVKEEEEEEEEETGTNTW